MRTLFVKDKLGFNNQIREISEKLYDSRKHTIIGEAKAKYEYEDSDGGEVGSVKPLSPYNDWTRGAAAARSLPSSNMTGPAMGGSSTLTSFGSSKPTGPMTGPVVYPKTSDSSAKSEPESLEDRRSRMDREVEDAKHSARIERIKSGKPDEYQAAPLVPDYSKKDDKTGGNTVGTVRPLSSLPPAPNPIVGASSSSSSNSSSSSSSNSGGSNTGSSSSSSSGSSSNSSSGAQQQAPNSASDDEDDFLDKMGASEESRKMYKDMTPEMKQKVLKVMQDVSKARMEKAKQEAVKSGITAPASKISEAKVPDSWEDNSAAARKKTVKSRLAPKTIPGKTVSENLFSEAEIAHLRSVLETAVAPARADQAADVNQVSQKNILDEAGRGRPPKEGSPAWHKRQKEAAADNPNVGQGRDPRQHIQVIAGQAMGGRVMDFKHNDGSVSKITPAMGRRINGHLNDLKPAARQDAVNKMHDSADGLKV